MEYPFKDLMPLDEATARDGYYKDWTHLDPEVFYSLTQISEYIKTKGYGVDVRLLIAQLAEHFGLKTTQIVDLANLLSTKHDALKDQFDVVIRDATSGADWGGEIVLARGGKATLGQRLDETDAKLAQNVTQSDFAKLLHDHNDLSGKLIVDVKGGKSFGVTIPSGGGIFSYLSFSKNTLDDYIRFREGSYIKKETVYKGNYNYDSIDGDWSVTTGVNHYTITVGSSFSVVFNGTGVDLGHYIDNRGGLWELVVDGDTDNKVTISTHSDDSSMMTWSPVFRGLEDGEHNLVATFLGKDPKKTYTEAARGWVSWSNHLSSPSNISSIRVFKESLNKIDVFDEASVKEFAITIRDPHDSNQSSVWMPQHGTNGTVFEENANSQRVYFDGEENLDWRSRTGIAVSNVRIEQKLLAYNPLDKINPLVRIFAVHTINNKGLHIKHTFEAIRDVYMGTGYPMMFPITNTFPTKMITSLKEEFDTSITDGSRSLINGHPTSFAMTNNEGVVVAMTVDDPQATYMLDKEREEFMFFEHRSNLQKVYIPTFQDHTMKAGDTYTMGGTYYIGELPFANDILV